MSCMADVHEVQETNDKSKFHRQIKKKKKTTAPGKNGDNGVCGSV